MNKKQLQLSENFKFNTTIRTSKAVGERIHYYNGWYAINEHNECRPIYGTKSKSKPFLITIKQNYKGVFKLKK